MSRGLNSLAYCLSISSRQFMLLSNTLASLSSIPIRHGKVDVTGYVFYIPENMAEPLEFFDSLGKKPEHYSNIFTNFLTTFGKNYKYSSHRLQEQQSFGPCGEYVLYFIAHRTRGLSFEDVVNIVHKNDRVVRNFVKNHYVEWGSI